MAGLVPAIHVFKTAIGQDVDPRNKSGDDGKGRSRLSLSPHEPAKRDTWKAKRPFAGDAIVVAIMMRPISRIPARSRCKARCAGGIAASARSHVLCPDLGRPCTGRRRRGQGFEGEHAPAEKAEGERIGHQRGNWRRCRRIYVCPS